MSRAPYETAELPPDPLTAPVPEDPIGRLLQRVAQAAHPAWEHEERRAYQRLPYPKLISLTPVADDGITPVGETITVVGRNLSLGGLDFYHNQPLAHRRMIATLECGPGRSARLLLVLNWCRFLRPGWYDSGGRFTRIVECPEKFLPTPQERDL